MACIMGSVLSKVSFAVGITVLHIPPIGIFAAKIEYQFSHHFLLVGKKIYLIYKGVLNKMTKPSKCRVNSPFFLFTMLLRPQR